jgi:hypothetical protein
MTTTAEHSFYIGPIGSFYTEPGERYRLLGGIISSRSTSPPTPVIDTGVDGLVLLEDIIPPSSHYFYYYRWVSAGSIPVLVD